MNRRSYDKCAYAEAVTQSVSPISFILDPIKYEHCTKCRPELGIVGGTAVSHVKGNLVDLENNLIGIDRPGTLCASLMFHPTQPGEALQGIGQYKSTCYPKIDTAMLHLPKCQFQTYPEVPNPPKPPPYACNYSK